MVHAHKTLKKHGIPCTAQRKLILKSIWQNHSHPDVESVHNELKKRMPSLSLDTVYRTLALFADKGLIQRLALPTARAHYDGNAAPHDHFYCQTCQKVIDIESKDGAQITLPNSMDGIADIEVMQRLYYGTCSNCAAANTSVSCDSKSA